MALAASAFAAFAVLGCARAFAVGSVPALAFGLADALAALCTFCAWAVGP